MAEETDKKIEIPQAHKEICQEFVALARKLGLHSLSVKFTTNDSWSADINFAWQMGRHESGGEITISSTFFAWAKEKEEVKNDG